MANITFHNEPAHTAGDLPKVGTVAPDFSAVKNDLAEVKLSDFKGKKVILNIFPSVDTGVCAASVRKFHVEASKLNNVAILCISKDLPFALTGFEQHYPIAFTDSPLKGLLSRSVVVVDENGKVVYTEQVAETTDEPNYAKALEAIK